MSAMKSQRAALSQRSTFAKYFKNDHTHGLRLRFAASVALVPVGWCVPH